MKRPPRDVEHLVRLALLFLAGIVVFLAARTFLIPPGFGELGHYRTGALADNVAQPLRYAGRAACTDCHEDDATTLAGGAHTAVGCESCHGPLAAHAADPADTAQEAMPKQPLVEPLQLLFQPQALARPDREAGARAEIAEVTHMVVEPLQFEAKGADCSGARRDGHLGQRLDRLAIGDRVREGADAGDAFGDLERPVEELGAAGRAALRVQRLRHRGRGAPACARSSHSR